MMLFCPVVFGVCKIFNIKPEKVFFCSEYLSIKVKTQVVHTLNFLLGFFFFF